MFDADRSQYLLHVHVDYAADTFVVIDGVRFPAVTINAEAEPDVDEHPAWYLQLPMENHVILLLFVPDDGQVSAGLLLDVGRSPAEHMEFEACIERRNGTLQIRPTLWAQHHSEATTPEAICDLLQDPAWSSDVDDVAEVLDYLRRWSQLPVVNVTAVG